jgi:hypothetical protein
VPEPGEVVPPRNPFAELGVDVSARPEPKAKPHNRLPPPEVADEPEATGEACEPADPPADRDLDRAYFPTRAMLPELTLLGIVAVGWIMGAVPFLPERFQTWEVLASIPGAYGLFVGIRWMYRLIGGGYRLTRTQLLRVNAGPIPDPEPIDLATVASVVVEQSAMDVCLCVGAVKLTFERDAQPEIVLGPLGWPKRRAKLIQEAIEAARAGQVFGGRVAA